MNQPGSRRLRSSLRRLALVTPLALLLLLFGVLPTARAAPLAPNLSITCAATGWGFTVSGTGLTGIPANISGSITIAGTTATYKTTTGGFSASFAPPAPLAGGTYRAKVVIATFLTVTIAVSVPTCGGGGGGTGTGTGITTPELASGELFALGLLPVGGLVIYRRRRSSRRPRHDTATSA